ncbi:MAG: fumarylacetoacetate hydrolase family protein [Bacteroidia bacterium]|nr:fumarylacetoacetate hydrolase family protein [Bacteroidia bacterium]MDW8157495.1 fumarylacetoacetate hydrolase family protein [Bacteroidia bacterium]
MKLVNFYYDGELQVGLVYDSYILRLREVIRTLQNDLAYIQVIDDIVKEGEKVYELILQIHLSYLEKGKYSEYSILYEDVKITSPILRPASCRDAYAFRQHVEAARRNRGVEMIPEFDEYPVFYFTNHNAITGPGPVFFMPDHFQKLDFELEAAVVIGKKGKNIKAEEADKYIFGYTIMNDWSARVLQMEEMKLNLGPAKGKDFATSLGPMLVTPDELEKFRIPPPINHIGSRYNLKMKAYVNNKLVSEGSLGDMDWTFAEIIERASYGTEILPTDVIGSGTVGTGCFLELNGTHKRMDPNYQEQWLQPGDVVRLEIEELGKLENTIFAEETDFSILQRKKKLS